MLKFKQIDEISKGLRDKYVERAVTAHGGYNMARRNTTGADQEYFARKEKNTQKGISRALDDKRKISEDASSAITDSGDRRQYNSLRAMQSDRLSKAKKSKDVVAQNHTRMAQQHGDAAEAILDKYRKESMDIEEAKATMCGRCGTKHVPPSKGGTCPAVSEATENNEVLDEASVDDKISKVASIYNKHRELADKARRVYPRDTEGEAKHMKGSSKAFALMHKMRTKKSEADKAGQKPKPVQGHTDYSAAIAKDYKDQEAKRGIGHVRDHVERNPYGEVLAELRDIKIREEIATEATSAAIRLQRAFQREMERSEASRKRGEELLKQKPTTPAPKKEETEMKTFKQIMEASGKNVHPDALHVSPVKVEGKTKYKVHAVGKNFSHGVKVGEHLSDSELDDFSEMGGKVKHVKQ